MRLATKTLVFSLLLTLTAIGGIAIAGDTQCDWEATACVKAMIDGVVQPARSSTVL